MEPTMEAGAALESGTKAALGPVVQTRAGEVTLTVPKLRSPPFETATIDRYQRRES